MYRIFVFFALLLTACQSTPSSSENQDATQSEGRALSLVHCGSCHQYPSPALLDSVTWQTTVLPRMGYLMGIYPDGFQREELLEQGAGARPVEAANIFPETPTISKEDYQKIVQFYIKEAPQQLERPARAPLQVDLPLFKLKVPEHQQSPPGTTLVRFTKTGFYVGDAQTRKLLQFDAQLKLQNSIEVGEGAVWIEGSSRALLLTLMGSFSPTDQASGGLLSIQPDFQQTPTPLIRSLQRPVHSSYGDLNGDGRLDVVTCEFGKWTGQLSWWELPAGKAPVKHVLHQAPGATKAYIKDMNGDQLPDIVALFAQGDEGIFTFYNQGDGQFKMERSIRFSPSNGSSYFALYDWDQDGLVDILYTAGDNADYSPILKPYHGIYIYRNLGQQQFDSLFFYPLPGAYKVIPNDFDQDGDTDLAAISFFPDFASGGTESFVYLENRGNDQFTPRTFEGSERGRWLVMDAGDPDGDGDTDLILGSLAFEVVDDQQGHLDRWIKEGIPFVVLENQLKD